MPTCPNVKALVLDATPLITQSYSHYQNYAESFYTTPTVFSEIRDENARKNIEIWQGLGTLNIRHPKETSIKRVSQFAKLTGDYSVLSANDLHILALAYELEVELNGGDWRLRNKPGDLLSYLKDKSDANSADQLEEGSKVVDAVAATPNEKKKRRRGGKKQRAKREAALAEQGEILVIEQQQPTETSEPAEEAATQGIPQEELGEHIDREEQQPTELVEDYNEADDDGEWITPENLTETLIKDSGEDVTGNEGAETVGITPENQVALATGDFAIQNVALQLNLNLMNFMSGMRIKRLRNYMLRCHACFKMYPLPKDGKTKHFCSACGGCSTLIRCAVSVDSETGEVTPHLKGNFQWNNRGNRYSLASPLSKNSQKRFGKKGFVHTKHAQDVILLNEDQKEYQKALKQDEWTRRNNEKVLNDWVGGGSADNCISPFAISGLKHHSVRVGRGRHINSAKKRA